VRLLLVICFYFYLEFIDPDLAQLPLMSLSMTAKTYQPPISPTASEVIKAC